MSESPFSVLRRHVRFWRFGVTVYAPGMRGVYVGVPFVGDAVPSLGSRMFGLRWIGVCW